LKARTEAGQPSLLDDYGATDPAEFFAVVTEVFFEQPHALREENAALYAELSRFFRVDPAAWQAAVDARRSAWQESRSTPA
jgi:Mlc titration factor MtfA (ptsG expression regulator)